MLARSLLIESEGHPVCSALTSESSPHLTRHRKGLTRPFEGCRHKFESYNSSLRRSLATEGFLASQDRSFRTTFALKTSGGISLSS